MTETEVVENSGERTRVGFPEAPTEKPKSSKGLIIVIILLLVLLGVGGWYMFGRQQIATNQLNTTPTPTVFEATSSPTPTEVEAEVIREGVEIQVLNGTGISGAASSLQKGLEELGYTGIKVGNASPQNAVKTTVVFATTVDDAVREDILKLLEEMYEDVTESEKSMTDFDVIITTGYPKGHTATSGPTARPTTSTSATVTPTRTLSGTTTVTITPTKTPTPTP